MTPEQPTIERAIELLSREAPSTEGDGSYWRRWASDLTWIVPRYWPLVLAELARLRERNAALTEALQMVIGRHPIVRDCTKDECVYVRALLAEPAP